MFRPNKSFLFEQRQDIASAAERRKNGRVTFVGLISLMFILTNPEATSPPRALRFAILECQGLPKLILFEIAPGPHSTQHCINSMSPQ